MTVTTEDLESFQPTSPDSLISHADASRYWNTQPASVTGMLGGIPQVSKTDLQGSKNFFAKVQRRSLLGKRRRDSQSAASRGVETSEPGNTSNGSRQGETERNGDFRITRAVDCGAGIGRVTLGFISIVAASIDIVEPMTKFTREISEGAAFADLRANGRVGKICNTGLEAWTPEDTVYDLIWHQWCLGQLTDEELVAYLRRAKAGLTTAGWIGVKENCAAGDVDEFDALDSTVTRCLGKWRDLFTQSGLKIELEEVQKGFPKGLFVVRMWALRAE